MFIFFVITHNWCYNSVLVLRDPCITPWQGVWHQNARNCFFVCLMSSLCAHMTINCGEANDTI